MRRRTARIGGARRRAFVAACLFGATILLSPRASAGPPFLTDDPVPVERRHFELYIASQWAFDRDAATGTLPTVELNYGAATNLQLHLIVPAAVSRAGSHLDYGLGDVEIGAKLRLFGSGDAFQLAVFPELDFPTGAESRGLGAGEFQLFLPAWLQKSFGAWTVDTGGGVLLTSRGHDDVFAGALVQRQVTKALTLGAELFATLPLDDAPVVLQANAGAIVDLTDDVHVLLSVGPARGGDERAQAYAALLFTW